MKVLAIDHGLARIGCAVSDPSGTIVRPLDVIEPPSVDAVSEVALAEEAEIVVVGLPVTLGGAVSTQAELALGFCEELRERIELPVVTYDERLTTRMAQGSRSSGARAAEDSLAAAHLLESYLMAAARGSAR